MNTVKINKNGAKMVAHRGVSGLEKENTSFAFLAAGNRSYFGVETDIHKTADGKYILIHDDDTNRVSGVNLPVEGTDFDTLRSLRLLDIDKTTVRDDLRLPTAEEYIRICKKYEKVCVMELKNHFPAEDVAEIVEIFRREDYLDHAIFISFDAENLISLRALLPDQPIQYLLNKLDEGSFELMKRYRFDLDIRHSALTEEWVKRLHEAGISINCWTVNEPADADRLIAWGVDYITTNILE